jgi:hypothetical protein
MADRMDQISGLLDNRSTNGEGSEGFDSFRCGQNHQLSLIHVALGHLVLEAIRAGAGGN